MAGRKLKANDFRGLPSYTISEAAQYLSVPATTIRYWSIGRGQYKPLIQAPRRKPTLLSFLNLTELHVLAAIRRKHGVKMPSVRVAIEYLAEHAEGSMGQRHPLISQDLDTDGLALFVEQYGQLINISQAGQIAMREIIHAALQRIDRDLDGVPIKLYPFTRSAAEDTPAMIVIDPRLSAGRPVIAGTGLATELIAERYKAGESIAVLAQDYERENAEIEEAVRCELKAAA
ncbi:MAG: DUF433 domain-containing protein [Gammaproteobacteria bacterium]|nr:DUF433 domain-containing protein [Gammaproteobacteria bacterium]MYD01382.1 DUF433 domain-containing protein [Gammaproteobacteria bacterium]MYI25282.1 DUF433 domain-containing protein [Gammaproteobacteria bacterium]